MKSGFKSNFALDSSLCMTFLLGHFLQVEQTRTKRKIKKRPMRFSHDPSRKPNRPGRNEGFSILPGRLRPIFHEKFFVLCLNEKIDAIERLYLTD